jgi:hypothetical protein
MKEKQDLEENILGFVDISPRRYKLCRDVEQTPRFLPTRACGSQRWQISLLLDVFALARAHRPQSQSSGFKRTVSPKLDLPENDVS